MTISAGTRLGPYELVALLGAGGMGQVYRARDTRLDRSVAIKILSADLATDPVRRERFEREARAVSSLGHPHICALYDVGQATPSSQPSPLRGEGARSAGEGELHYLVMELLEGETLGDRLLRGTLEAHEVLGYAIEIADALDHAHRHGVIHRDLKPSNIILTRSGTKLLDFGLAKLCAPDPVASASTLSLHPSPLTADGTILGTLPYMAPEQVQGEDADVRTDIFAFGAVLYEMVTGCRAFEGKSQASLIAAILEHQPRSISEQLRITGAERLGSTSSSEPRGMAERGWGATGSRALDHVVTRCLAKNPDDRWQTARDLMLELKWLAAERVPIDAGTERDVAAKSARRGPMKVGLIATAALSVLAIAGAVLTVEYLRRAPANDSMVRFEFSPPDGLTLTNLGSGGPVTISPDGKRVAFVATTPDGRQGLWVRPLDSLAAQALPGTDGAAYPFWSPDSRFLGFFAQGKLKKIQVSGGPPQTLCDAIQPRGGTWSRDGVIVFSAGIGYELSRVSDGGGAAMPLPADGSNQERNWPFFLPDGRHFVYFGRPQKYGIYVASLDSSDTRLLLSDYVSVAYSPPGYLLVLDPGSARGARAGTLFALPFDPARLQITGEPSPVAERIEYLGGLGRGAFSVSENGTLVYGTIESPTRQLSWFDRSGTVLGTVGGAFAYNRPSLSPDEKTIAVERLDPVTQTDDIWLIETTRDVASRFTFYPNFDIRPVWSPDGTRIVFSSARGTPPNLYQRARSGGGEELLVKSSFNSQPTDWSRDGRSIVFASLDPKTQWDLWLLPMSAAETDRKPIPFLQTEYNEHLGRFSPDGRWLAYASDESGTNDVYIRTFPESGGKGKISVNGGSEPRWRRDGRELFYLAADGRLMAVSVKPEPSLEVGAPAALFKTRISGVGASGTLRYDMNGNYTVTGDGQRFLISMLTEESTSVPTTIVLNWPAALGRP